MSSLTTILMVIVRIYTACLIISNGCSNGQGNFRLAKLFSRSAFITVLSCTVLKLNVFISQAGNDKCDNDTVIVNNEHRWQYQLVMYLLVKACL